MAVSVYYGTYHEDQGGYGYFKLIGLNKIIDYAVFADKDLPEMYDCYPGEKPAIYELKLESENHPLFNLNDKKIQIISVRRMYLTESKPDYFMLCKDNSNENS